jgi:hypothetical protein
MLDVLNEISNYESAGASENKPAEARAQDDQMKDLLQEMVHGRYIVRMRLLIGLE